MDEFEKNEIKGFRIIAIKTGSNPKRFYQTKRTGAKLDPFKVLVPNTVYPFNNNFKFPKNDFSEIIYDPSYEFNLYTIINKEKSIPLNLSVVVGENGSGKSTLIELLNWSNYNIGCSIHLLKNEETGKTLESYKFLNLELLYSTHNDIYFRMSFSNGKVYLQKLELKDRTIIQNGKRKLINSISDLKNFFYSIVINYSQYALNSLEIGNWIDPLFHKNDGYQTPIVLNPMRIRGNIDINKEKKLLSRRLQANILEDIGDELPLNSLRNISNGKIATSLKLIYNSNYHPFNSLHEPKKNITVTTLLSNIKKYFKCSLTEQQINDDIFINITINYIIEKLIKISKLYRPFRKFHAIENGKDSLKYIEAYIKKVKDSNSHIVFKVKGAILYLKYFKHIFNTDSVVLNEAIILDVNELSKTITKINSYEDFWVNTFMMAPPSFFNVEIILHDSSSIDLLSSGEKQRIHSISSIIYNLININSVGKLSYEEDSEEKYLPYSNVNIVLDEIELYYHPEWQRKYISDLISFFSRINPRNIDKIQGINMIILTHSPYILSDIPSCYVLKLDHGEVKERNKDEETFGANIHDLLANDFFMKAFIGEYAKIKIKEFLKWADLKAMTNKKQEVFYKKLIDIIGDPIIKSRLHDLYNKKIKKPTYNDLVKEINRLKKINKNEAN
jgi:predicted ATP-binding protein involved in virulence